MQQTAVHRLFLPSSGNFCVSRRRTSLTVGIRLFSAPEYLRFMRRLGQILLTFSVLVYYRKISCNIATKMLGNL